MSKVIEFKNVHFGYTSVDILRCVSFDINSGDFVSIIGSNGAGKSTILKLILGELHQYRGSIKLYEEDISKFKDWRKVGYLEQNAYSKIANFPATVYEIVMSNNFADMPKLFAFALIYECAVWIDSFITSPSWPVNVHLPFPNI